MTLHGVLTPRIQWMIVNATWFDFVFQVFIKHRIKNWGHVTKHFTYQIHTSTNVRNKRTMRIIYNTNNSMTDCLSRMSVCLSFAKFIKSRLCITNNTPRTQSIHTMYLCSIPLSLLFYIDKRMKVWYMELSWIGNGDDEIIRRHQHDENHSRQRLVVVHLTLQSQSIS